MTHDPKVWRRQVFRFLIVGLTTVCVDWSTYLFFLWLPVQVSVAKACGFLAGTSCAYLANRLWTFREHRQDGFQHVLSFILLYLATLGINVATNAFLLSVFQSNEMHLLWAFIGATAVSSTLNFLGMKFFVFAPVKLSK